MVAFAASLATSPHSRRRRSRLLAQALSRVDERERAVGVLRTARRVHPDDVGLGMGLARTLRSLGSQDGPEAVHNYAVAVALRPDSMEAWQELGLMRESARGQPGEALEDFRAALERRPDDAHLRFHAAHALGALGQGAQSIAEYRRALALDPDDVLSHNNLGAELERGGDWAGAVAEYRRTLELDPGYLGAHRNLAFGYERQGDIQAAIAAARAGLERNQGELGLMAALAWNLATSEPSELRDPAEAVRLMRRVIELEPGDGNAWNTLGVALYRHGELEECVRTLQRSTELRAGGDGYDWFFLAMAEQTALAARSSRRSGTGARSNVAQQPSVTADFERFRAEAELVLGVAK